MKFSSWRSYAYVTSLQVDATCNATSMVLEANDQCGASSSAGPSDAINKLNEKTKDLTPVSGMSFLVSFLPHHHVECITPCSYCEITLLI